MTLPHAVTSLAVPLARGGGKGGEDNWVGFVSGGNKEPEASIIHLGIAGASVCRTSLQEPPLGSQLWKHPESWEADVVNVRAEIA